MAPSTAIDLEWLKKYVDSLVGFAASVGVESKMGQAALLRAEHVMDVVKAWREHGK